ncbi:MAG: glucose-1-phosphate thymidylyltransferase, partial [Chitinophagaceae bacterium]|nr:glucose-1-phosphate thymidylyltransferase [Chitinophagaceae bacterium]
MLKEVNIVLFDTVQRGLLYPFTQTRAVADIRFGILTVKERWELIAEKKVETLTAGYINSAETLIPGKKLFINAAILPNTELLKMLDELRPSEVIIYNNHIIAFWGEQHQFISLEDISNARFNKVIEINTDAIYISHPWHLFQYNDTAIRFDFALLTKGRQSKNIPDTNKLISSENIFIEDSAVLEHCIINASAGPVY